MDQAGYVLRNVGVSDPDRSTDTVAQHIACCSKGRGAGLVETYAENLAHGLSAGSGLSDSTD